VLSAVHITYSVAKVHRPLCGVFMMQDTRRRKEWKRVQFVRGEKRMGRSRETNEINTRDRRKEFERKDTETKLLEEE